MPWQRRLAEVGLELHPDKTRVVYCKDADRRGDHEVTSFTFLGYTFRPRLAKNRWGKHFVSFLPAVSKDAVKAMSREIRSWHIARRSDKSLTDLAQMFNSIVQGWINYYGRFYKSMLYPLLRRINEHLVRWACRKYKRLRRREKTSKGTPGPRRSALPSLVRPLAIRPQTRWLDDGSRVSREASARFCERRGVRFPPPTLLVVCCHSRQQAEQVRARLAEWLEPRGLAFNEAKTRIVPVTDGFDFLGFNLRLYPNGKLLIKPGATAIKRFRERLAKEFRALRGANIAAVLAKIVPITRGWVAYYRTVVSSRVFAALTDYLWKLTYKWACWSHPNKPKRWITGRYFGKFNKFRNDRWVFGDRDTGAYLPKPSWTDIVRHILVKSGASPDDPAQAGYWAQRRRKVKPPLDSYTVRLLSRQDGRCSLCGENLLTRDQPPQSPEGWERWFLQVTRQAIKADYLVHHDTLSAARSNRTHLVHDTCHRSRNQPRTARNTVMQQTN